MTAPKKTLAEKLADTKAEAEANAPVEIRPDAEAPIAVPAGGFFGNYEDEGGGGGMYLSGLEKDVLHEEGAVFPVTAVNGPKNDGYKGKSRFVLAVEIEGEPRLLGLDAGTVFSRDRMLLAMQDWLSQDGAEAPLVKLAKNDRSWVLEDAEAAE